MTHRLTGIAGTVLISVALVAGCGASGPSASDVVDQLGALYPTPDPRVTTDSCSSAGCESRVTTGAVTVTRWPDDQTAARATAIGEAEQVGPFVLSYDGTDQQATSSEAKQAYAAKVRELVANS